jgi:hypothetical protein
MGWTGVQMGVPSRPAGSMRIHNFQQQAEHTTIDAPGL